MDKDKITRNNKGIKGLNQYYPKGMSGNPAGRPKGTKNENTKRYVQIKNLASEKYQEAFDIVWQNVEKGEAWAVNLFFKELVPKNVYQKTAIVEYNGDSIDDQIKAVVKALQQFDDLTREELLHKLRVLTNVKTNETADTQVEIVRETRESLMENLKLVNDVLNKMESNK